MGAELRSATPPLFHPMNPLRHVIPKHLVTPHIVARTPPDSPRLTHTHTHTPLVYLESLTGEIMTLTGMCLSSSRPHNSPYCLPKVHRAIPPWTEGNGKDKFSYIILTSVMTRA
ncbi:hypothetical protein E2C01_016891 [Portunus trituberculatus]|uniref:Uncharacterized protein n=1 Tax=Portunus trituberculatus TaxID=210409 RepID=A0A5B7DSC7_PORTR|nr:hypothetical protein [Portunus trituberculatus]